MERPKKQKSTLLKWLPKPASAGNQQIPHVYNKGFSGPINYAVLPDEARRRPKTDEPGFDEPTSPKVSCMGQIKYRHKKKKKNKKVIINKSSDQDHHHDHYDHGKERKPKQVMKKSISELFSRRAAKKMNHDKEGRVVAADNSNDTSSVPSLGMMKKYTSGRDTMADFDWTAQIGRDRDCFSDGDGDEDEREGGEREVIIPFSAPLLMGGRESGLVLGLGFELEPRKEVNLWKRRTMAPPPPLALNSKVRS